MLWKTLFQFHIPLLGTSLNAVEPPEDSPVQKEDVMRELGRCLDAQFVDLRTALMGISSEKERNLLAKVTTRRPNHFGLSSNRFNRLSIIFSVPIAKPMVAQLPSMPQVWCSIEDACQQDWCHLPHMSAGLLSGGESRSNRCDSDHICLNSVLSCGDYTGGRSHRLSRSSHPPQRLSTCHVYRSRRFCAGTFPSAYVPLCTSPCSSIEDSSAPNCMNFKITLIVLCSPVSLWKSAFDEKLPRKLAYLSLK